MGLDFRDRPVLKGKDAKRFVNRMRENEEHLQRLVDRAKERDFNRARELKGTG